MFKSLMILVAASLWFCPYAQAQVFHARRAGSVVKTTVAKPVETVVNVEEPAPEEQPAAEVKEQLPTAATPAEIVKAQAPMMKSLKYAARNYNAQQLRGIVDALNTMSQTSNRRLNLTLPAEEQIDFQKDRINIKDTAAVEKYFNEKFIEPLGKSFAQDEPAEEEL